MENKIAIIMGSDSDWGTMQEAAKICKEFGIAYEAKVISAHRTPDLALEYAENAYVRGIRAIIARIVPNLLKKPRASVY